MKLSRAKLIAALVAALVAATGVLFPELAPFVGDLATTIVTSIGGL